MQITKELLKEWNACTDGYRWFLANFPQGGDVQEIGEALRNDKRTDDASWLISNVFAHFIKAPEFIGSYTEGEVKAVLKSVEGSPNTASGYSSTSAASGDYSKSAASGNSSTSAASGYSSTSAASGYSSTSAASGDYSKSAASGYSSTSAASGYYITSAASGDYSTSAASGNSSTSAASGYSSTSAASGDYSTATAKGKKTIAMVAGLQGKASAGELGVFALPYLDAEDRIRIAVGIVGEDGIKADTLYEVIEGKLTEVQE